MTCELKKLVDDSHDGEWGVAIGRDDDGAVVDIHVYTKGVTARDFLSVIDDFETSFNDDEPALLLDQAEAIE